MPFHRTSCGYETGLLGNGLRPIGRSIALFRIKSSATVNQVKPFGNKMVDMTLGELKAGDILSMKIFHTN